MTTVDEAWSVVHVIVAVIGVTLDATPEMTGGGVVATVKLPEVDDAVEPFTETTSKSYVVPGVRPLSVTE